MLLHTDPRSYKFTIRTKRKRTKNERTLHTNDTENARYTKRTYDTRNERMIHERTNEMKRTNYTESANERYTKRTNESLERNHILSNDKRSWFYRSTI